MCLSTHFIPCSHIISLPVKAFQDLSAHGSSPNYYSCFALSVASSVCVKTLLREVPFGSLSNICSLYIFILNLSQNFCTDEIKKPFSQPPLERSVEESTVIIQESHSWVNINNCYAIIFLLHFIKSSVLLLHYVNFCKGYLSGRNWFLY